MVVSLRRCLMFRDGNVVMKGLLHQNIPKSVVMPTIYEVCLSVVFSSFEMLIKPVSFSVFKGCARKEGKSLEDFSLYRPVCEPLVLDESRDLEGSPLKDSNSC